MQTKFITYNIISSKSLAMPGYTFRKKLILGVEIAKTPLDSHTYIKDTICMTPPDPRQALKAPTALEALRAYIKEWSKTDASLKQYYYDEIVVDDILCGRQ